MKSLVPIREAFHRWITSRDVPVVVQFMKYGCCGVLAVLVYLLTISLLVALYPEWVGDSLSDGKRAWNFNIFQGIAFIPANVVAYLLNRRFVFTPGRHKTSHEFFWFLVVALISSGAGLVATDLLIRYWSAPNWTGAIASVVASAMMNFVCRKFFVFAR